MADKCNEINQLRKQSKDIAGKYLRAMIVINEALRRLNTMIANDDFGRAKNYREIADLLSEVKQS